MDSKKSKSRMNSNTQNHAKPRRSLRIQLSKKKLIPELPLDIMINIISRLPLKLIVACKSLSRDFKNLISDPSFSQIYLTNKSNYFCAIFVNRSKPVTSLDFVEFDKRDIYNEKGGPEIGKVTIIKNLDKITGGGFSECGEFSIYGCNGLFCLLKVEFDLYRMFVTNPILSEYIELPEPVVLRTPKLIALACGIGYCQSTNRYKVLRIITEYIGGTNYKNNTQIFTFGSDQNWRSVSDVNVPYNIKFGHFNYTVQAPMIPLCSALHWVVQPVPVTMDIELEPNWGGTNYICAFDMTSEKVSSLALPPKGASRQGFYGVASVLLDKLCVIRLLINFDLEVWVMDEYGVEASWTKQFVLNLSPFRIIGSSFAFAPLAVSPEGVIALQIRNKFVFYGMKKKKWLGAVSPSGCYNNIRPFVPCFVSHGNLVKVADRLSPLNNYDFGPGICELVS